MAIHFDPKNKAFYLHSKNCTYAFAINTLGIGEHLYFGSPVGNDLPWGKYCKTGRAHSGLRQDADQHYHDLSVMPQEIHTQYGGDFYEPSLVLCYANGNRRSDLTYTGHEILAQKPALAGLPSIRFGQTLAVTTMPRT